VIEIEVVKPFLIIDQWPWYTDKMVCGQNDTDKMVLDKWYGQNGIRQNGMDIMVWTEWYWTKWYGQNGTDRMIQTKWYGQNGMDRMVLDKMVRTEWYGQNVSNFWNRYKSSEFNTCLVTKSHK